MSDYLPESASISTGLGVEDVNEIRWRTKLEVLIDCKHPVTNSEGLVESVSTWLAYRHNWKENLPLSIFNSTAQGETRYYCRMYRDPDEKFFTRQPGVSTLPPYRTPVLLEDIEPLLQFVEDALQDAQRDDHSSDKLEALHILRDVYQAIAIAQEMTLEQVCRQRCKDGFSIRPDDFNALNEENC